MRPPPYPPFGIAAMSMRMSRRCSALGMSLYHHVPSKEALLDVPP